MAGTEDDIRFVRRELSHDLTPPGVLLCLRRDSHPFALTGSWAGGGAVLGSEPLRVRRGPGPVAEVLDDPVAEAAGGFFGGWIGYLGYRVTGEFEPVPPGPGRDRRLPPWWFGYYDHVLRWDGDRWWFEAIVTAGREAEIDRRYAELTRRLTQPVAPRPYTCGDFAVTPAPSEHVDAVARAIDLIKNGDIFQANICLRLEAGFDGDPLDLFHHGVGELNPPYAAFLRVTPDAAIASLSPELFLRRSGRTVLTSPVKGTAERTGAPGEREELERSAKNQAENTMIVDLMRSDLSRVCEPGTVRVPRLAGAEPHPGVWHLVSDVTGQLAVGQRDGDLLRACFPPGSVTGAPKVRALEVIAELETAAREAYTGAIGYRGAGGMTEFNVAIRTFEFRGGKVWIGAGGGITAASDPKGEYRECLLKARPLIERVGGRFAATGGAARGGAARGGAVADGPRTHPDAELAALWPRPAAGVFTSLRARNGAAPGLDDHLARLERSVRALYGKELPLKLQADIAAVLRPGAEGRLRITARIVSGHCVTTTELVPAGPPPACVRLRPVAVDGGLGEHKWADRRLLNSMAGEQGEFLLIHDTGGEVLEADRANVFAVVDGVLRTPEADGRILPGMTRAAVLEAARAAGIETAAGPLTVDELRSASEVFVTSSVSGVVPVSGLDGAQREWPVPGPVTVRLRGGTAKTRKRRPRVLIIDNYDSFTGNVAHLMSEAGARVEVVRNDDLRALDQLDEADGLVISPGPCSPAEAGISVAAVRRLGQKIPVLGICLGHQVIAAAYGGRIVRTAPVHGRTSRISHDGAGVLRGVPSPFDAARYHSLLVDESALSGEFEVTARTDGGLVMGIRHRTRPVEGVQFHPEAVLTCEGGRIAANFTDLVVCYHKSREAKLGW